MNLTAQRSLLRLAYTAALASPDPSTQNGALLMNEFDVPIIFGYNVFPKGVRDTPERWERPLKYAVVEHAERNAIYKGAKNGIRLAGLTMVCPWAACSDCARGIIQCGIKELVTHQQAHDRSPNHWKDSINIAMEMLSEAGVTVTFYNGDVFEREEEDEYGYQNEFVILHSGVFWTP